MQPEKVAETRAWLSRAKLDLRAAERLLQSEPALVEPALFHCQQAAEKALKGYLVWSDRTFSKTHDLIALLALCVSVEREFTILEDAAVALTP